MLLLKNLGTLLWAIRTRIKQGFFSFKYKIILVHVFLCLVHCFKENIVQIPARTSHRWRMWLSNIFVPLLPLLRHEHSSFNIYNISLVLTFMHSCQRRAIVTNVLYKYSSHPSNPSKILTCFRIKWERPGTAWINDLGIFTEILLGNSWHS